MITRINNFFTRITFGKFLSEDERVDMIIRSKFSFVIVKIMRQMCLGIGGAVVLYYFYPFTKSTYPLYIQYPLIAITAVLLAYGTLNPIFTWWRWYMNAMLLTTQNIIIIDWEGLLKRSAARIDYHIIDEIVVIQEGFRAWLYRYGTVIIKFSGTVQHAFHKVFHPDRIAQKIDEYREKTLYDHNYKTDNGIKDLLTGLISRHIQGDIDDDNVEKIDLTKRINTVPERIIEYRDSTYTPPKIPYNKPIITTNTHHNDDRVLIKKLDNTGGIAINVHSIKEE